MKKRILSILLTLCMVLSIAPAAVFAEGSTAPADITGEGTAENPYLIYTAAGLKAFRDKVNGQNGLTKQPGAHAKLMNDIVLNDGTFDEDGNYTPGASGKDAEAWTPIGYFKDDSDKSRYAGTFDGNGHTVKGLYVKGVEYAGLFGYAMNATIKNVTVDGYITTGRYSGGIVGYLSGGSITNCFNYCTVNSTRTMTAGIAGFIDEQCKITACGNAGTVSGTNVGGVVGYARHECVIQNCYNVGAVSAYSVAGGIAGSSIGSSFIACYNTGTVTKSENAYVGGIIGNGFNSGSFYFCYWLKGTAKNAAGFDPEEIVYAPEAKSKAEFADGTVLALLKNGETLLRYGKCDFPWEKCGYLSAAGMIVPLLKGQTADTFPIYTADDLKTFRDMVNSGESGAHAKLMNDIDLGGEQWTPIANYTGTFDGNGKTVSGLNVKDVVNAGLFDTLSGSAVVKSLTVAGSVEASNTDGDSYAGGIAAKMAGNAQIIDCVNNAAVKATVNNDVDAVYTAYVGGMAGHAGGSAKITGCTNNGTVDSNSILASAYTGGMAGYTEGGVVIENCLNAAELSAVANYPSRYLSDGVTEYDKIESKPFAGGMVGRVFDVTITGCYNTGAVTASGTGNRPQQPIAGGMLGFAGDGSVTVTDCGNTGKITASGTIQSVVGGIVGSTRASGGAVFTVSHCYSTGEVSSDDPATRYVGGIAGIAYAYENSYTISDCYWLTGSCGKDVGYNSENSVSVTRTEAHSKSDFADGTVLELLKQNGTTNAWDMCGYVEAADMTLPLLKWQTLNARKYDIYITGLQITSLNRNDVLGDGKVSFTYDEANKKGTLTLDGVNIVCNDLDDDYPIYAPDMENLEIVLKGENNIEAEWVAGIMADNLTFSGDGSIEISTDGYSNWPVSCDKTFTVNGGNVKISSIDYALLLDGALTVNGGTLELIASDEYGYAIDVGFNSLNIDLADDRIMITGTNPDGSDARITAASEVDTVKDARYVKILSKYIPIVYEPGQYGEGSAATQNKTYGEDFGLAGALFTRTGYKQIGWALSDGGDKAYELGSAYTGNEPLTLYPVWEAEQYSITYDPNGGTIGGGNVTGYTYGVGATLPTDVTRTGYTFDGWYDNAAFSGMAVTSISNTDSGNKTYYAKWTEKSNYIVIFISSGGTLANDKKTVKWTDKVLDGVADPTRNGYDFAGWKCVDTDVTSDTTYADLAVNDTVISVTLTAQWRDIAAPTGEIKIAENDWKSFLNTITFGLFFKDTQTVTVTAADNSGETVRIEYLLSDRKLSENELAAKTFTEYTAPFGINPDNEYVIYAKLTDTSGNVAYINTSGIVLDATVPVISGIENGKTYCAAQTVTVTEKYIGTVTVNGTKITLDENNQFTLSPAVGTQTVVVTDKAGNETRVTVTVNDGHTYEWQSENGEYWQKCKFCGDETEKKAIPEIIISGSDKVCRTQDYKFSFTLPEGAAEAAYGYEFTGLGDGPLTPSVEDNLYSGSIKASAYPAEENSFKLIVSAKTADGFDFFAEKIITIQNEHTGGTATCKDRAICEVCGESYGELNANNHADMKHVEAKAATKTAEGNIEYWYCDSCGKYFADKDGLKEITKADTVTAKLPEEKPVSPKTGDTSNLALWIALLFISGGVITGVTVAGKRKKQQD